VKNNPAWYIDVPFLEGQIQTLCSIKSRISIARAGDELSMAAAG
jgi:hypothetical protein